MKQNGILGTHWKYPTSIENEFGVLFFISTSAQNCDEYENIRIL
jgi:hypothetical protein